MTDNETIKACGEVCTDNRFELISKYKNKLIEGTNIEAREDEMAVIDSILFRCWQMDWLDKLECYEHQKAEIERLQTEKDNLIRTYKECMTEAIKEFAEQFEKRCVESGIYPAVTKNILKKLVKELTEGSNGE